MEQDIIQKKNHISKGLTYLQLTEHFFQQDQFTVVCTINSKT